METLKSCPFCGDTDIFIEPDERGSGGQWCSPIHVGCTKCQAEQCADEEADAIAAWNRRAAIQQAAGAVPEGCRIVPMEPSKAMLDRAVAFALNVSLGGSYGWTDYMRDLYARMLSAVPSKAGSSVHLVPCAGWLPIETAPDETPVWLVSEGGNIWIGERCWDGDGWMWGNCYLSIYQRADHTWASSDCEVDDDYQPVKWMPLPPPPARGNDAPTGQINKPAGQGMEGGI